MQAFFPIFFFSQNGTQTPVWHSPSSRHSIPSSIGGARGQSPEIPLKFSQLEKMSTSKRMRFFQCRIHKIYFLCILHSTLFLFEPSSFLITRLYLRKKPRIFQVSLKIIIIYLQWAVALHWNWFPSRQTWSREWNLQVAVQQGWLNGLHTALSRSLQDFVQQESAEIATK